MEMCWLLVVKEMDEVLSLSPEGIIMCFPYKRGSELGWLMQAYNVKSNVIFNTVMVF